MRRFASYRSRAKTLPEIAAPGDKGGAGANAKALRDVLGRLTSRSDLKYEQGRPRGCGGRSAGLSQGAVDDLLSAGRLRRHKEGDRTLRAPRRARADAAVSSAAVRPLVGVVAIAVLVVIALAAPYGEVLYWPVIFVGSLALAVLVLVVVVVSALRR